MKMKKTIALMLALLMCISLLSGCGGGGAAETKPAETPEPVPSEMPDGVFTSTYENGVVTISGRGVLDQDAVKACGAYDMLNGAEGVRVVLEPGVTEIGYNAFYYCFALTSVTIPESVTTIGEGAFTRCGSLTSVTIPESVTKIGIGAFFDCNSLTSVTISGGVIGRNAFYDCNSLTNVTILKGVIEDGAFSYCDALTSVTLSDGVTEIKSGAFVYCGLTSVTVPARAVIAEDAFDPWVIVERAG